MKSCLRYFVKFDPVILLSNKTMLLWFEIRIGRHNFSSLLAENLVPNSVEDVDYCGEILPFGSDLIGFVIEIFLHKKAGKQRNLCISTCIQIFFLKLKLIFKINTCYWGQYACRYNFRMYIICLISCKPNRITCSTNVIENISYIIATFIIQVLN